MQGFRVEITQSQRPSFHSESIAVELSLFEKKAKEDDWPAGLLPILGTKVQQLTVSIILIKRTNIYKDTLSCVSQDVSFTTI